MLDQPDRDLRELLHLGTHRPPDRHALYLGEQVPAIARVRPMLDDLIRHSRRQQIPATPPMPILSALFTPRGTLTPAGRLAQPVGARRPRGIPRVRRQLRLQHRDPLPLTLNDRGQLMDLTIHPQQHLNDDLSPRVIDRASFFPLHTTRFDKPELCPPTN